MAGIDTFLSLLRKQWIPWALAFVSGGILLADFYSGREVRLVYLLIVPVAIASLGNFKRFAVVLAAVLPFARWVFFLGWGEAGSFSVGFVNAAIRSFVLLFVAFFMDKVALMYQYRQELAVRELKDHVQRLEGLLPICSHCKSIRNENGEYESIEAYITKKSNVFFSHGICPKCLQRYYPEQAGVILGQTENSG